jgi:isopenicillin-N N-acyltransferase like protein
MTNRMRRSMPIFLVALFIGFGPSLRADEKQRYPEAKHGKGELKYVSGVPVLVVEGTPDEIGEQFGVLVLKPAKKPLLDRIDSYMKKSGWESVYPIMLRTSGFLMPIFPENNQAELRAAAKASGVERNILILTNAMPDLEKIGGCSTLVVESERSKTRAPLFGRILDWPPHEELPEFTLVAVFKSPKKHAVATVTFPVILGAISGMNDVGLSLSINEIFASKDKSPKSDLKGVPMLMLFRKLLEECASVDDVEKLLKDSRRTTYFSLTVCDKDGGCVFEVTPKNVIARKGVDGVCCCTNHFRTDELSVGKNCRRYAILEKAQKNGEKMGVDDIARELHKVNQGTYTVQSMVFEPAEKVLHLAYGGGKSATEKKLVKLELGPIFKDGLGK